MYTVGKLAKKFGLSRSTLLYYDSIGLLHPSHHVKGEYRHYSESDANTLRRICMYRDVGVSLKNIKHILNAQTPSATAEVLEDRLLELNEEVASLQHQQRIIAGLLSKSTLPENMDATTWTTMFQEAGFNTEEMRQWHAEFERMSPEDHTQFLEILHMPKKEIEMIRSWAAAPQSILQLKLASEEFMSTFFRIYEQLDRKGPGNYGTTQRALQFCGGLPENPKLLDIGCGSGANAVDLARMGTATITAIDIYEPYVVETRNKAIASGVAEQVKAQRADMAKLPFSPGSFDIIWSEGAAYIMGFDAALAYWKQFMAPRGYLVVSEAVWLPANSHHGKPRDLKQFWQEAYPKMRNTGENLNAIGKQGYKVLGNFIIPQDHWDEFYNTLEAHVAHLPKTILNRPYAEEILALIHREIQLYRKYRGHYGYEFYIMQGA
ncbi:MAG: MerR family transcriptional regulator [Desulfobacterales bacterium]|nr:MerR family transcriptional regulator [Desulfobacterales bacterium]